MCRGWGRRWPFDSKKHVGKALASSRQATNATCPAVTTLSVGIATPKARLSGQRMAVLGRSARRPLRRPGDPCSNAVLCRNALLVKDSRESVLVNAPQRASGPVVFSAQRKAREDSLGRLYPSGDEESGWSPWRITWM